MEPQDVQECYLEDKEIFNSLISDKATKKSLYRLKHSQYLFKSIHPADLDEHENAGWGIRRINKRTIQIKKQKSHDKLLEDRVWCLLYQMGYDNLSSDNFKIGFKRDDGTIGKKQIDIFSCDDETAFVIECKSKIVRGRKSLQKDLHETICLQEYLRKSIFSYYKEKPKPKIIWLYATNNIIWSEPDIERARSHEIYVVTENELQYFETFIKHMGPAGKYQILSEFLKNKKIPGMPDIRIPSIRGKIGGNTFYYFVTTPRALLKISFINHQAFNHPDGRPAYQRMIKAGRIKEIGNFITEGGFFPTNILVNFIDSPRFDLLSNKENTDPNIKFGWLELPKKYRSAWIIDGQHRLYGYSKINDKYLDQSLFVLAFEKMDTRKEADLFITINHKQKSVPNSLLVSLLADIRLGSPDPKTALMALSSAIIKALNNDNTSPLYRRFASPDIPAGDEQNLTISEAAKGLNRSGLLGKVLHGTIAPGPLCGKTDKDSILRAKKILNGYFENIRVSNSERWESGRKAYICVNPGIRAHCMLITDIINYTQHKKSIDFATITEEEFIKHLNEISEPFCNYINSADDDEIKNKFSRKFGEGGVKEYFYNICEIIHDTYDDFGSEEFKNYLDKKDDERVSEADTFIINLTSDINDYVIEVLKKVHGTHRMPSGEDAYWELGILNKGIKEKVYKKQLDDDPNKRLAKEAYLEVIDFKEIVQQGNNWTHFEPVFNLPMPNERKGKKYYTNWMVRFNELRRIPAHKSKLRNYSDDDFEFLCWLNTEFYNRLDNNRI